MPETSRGISYARGDITKTDLCDGTAHFVACLSVLEHGVDLRAFLQEMARVITPGGHLFVSVDYWEDPIDTGDRIAFGAPVKIFDAAAVRDFISQAKCLGLKVTSAPDLRCRERAVSWIGLEYTFLNLLFLRK